MQLRGPVALNLGESQQVGLECRTKAPWSPADGSKVVTQVYGTYAGLGTQ